MNEETPKLVFVVPDGDAPGYLERMLAVAGFTEMLETKKVTKSGFQDLIRFLADYVKEPEGLDERMALLRLASENEIKGLLLALANAGKVNPTSGGNSAEH
jgi:hypothetical protein